VVADLIERFGGTREAAVAAMQLPGFTEEFTRQTGARLETAPDGRPYPRFLTRESERPFWKLVEAAVGRDANEPTDRLQRRDPLPTRQTTEAVRLRAVERESWPKIEEAVRLSHRKVDYIRVALNHGDLGWDLDRDCLTLGPETRNTAAGLVLPVR
jgi:hypothetical protein